MKKTLSEIPETAKTINIPSRPRAKRKFTASDVDAICKHCARGLTESEAVRLLGKNPKAWFSFKSRASRTEVFASKLEEFSGKRIDQLLQQIEDAGTGKNRREPDWRASLAALKIMSQKRFGDSAATIELHQHQHALQLSDESKRKVEAMLKASLQPVVESAPAPAQIQDAEIVESDESNPS
jgi:hypothetical protein